MFCGIDWASERHAVCVLDDAGKTISAFQVAHTADGLEQLVATLRRYGDPAGLPVAIERPDGRLVDRLLEVGHPVVPVQPGAIKAWRDAEVRSGAKNDPGDAALIAEYLRLRRHRLRILQPFSPETRALRAVVRTRDDLVDQRVAATNQLAACLEAFWPGAKQVFAELHSPIALEFLTRYPTPESAAHLGERRMAAFCTKHGYSGRRPAAQLLARLHAAPAGLCGTVEVEARRDAVLALVGCCAPSTARSRTWTGRSSPTWVSTRTPRPSRRCQGRVRSTPPRCSPSGATADQPTTVPTPSPAWPARPRSPASPASTSKSAFAGRATNASARRCAPSPTTPATPAPGRPRSTAPPSRAAATIPTRSASWPAHGSG